MFVDIVKFPLDKASFSFAQCLGYSKIFTLKECPLKIVDGVSDAVNRKAVENKNVDIRLNPHQLRGKDHLHYRRSGLNHVLCRLAHKNHVAVAFSFDSLQDSFDFGRVRQNISLCRKYNVSLYFFSLASSSSTLHSASDVLSLLRHLGMSPGDAQEALSHPKLL